MSGEEETVKSWLFSNEQIRNSPSVSKGIAFEEERTARKVSCNFIAEIGQNLMCPPTVLAINSAKVFLNRYYMVEPLDNSPDKIFQHKLVGITCLFVACKTEECLRSLRHFIWAWNQIEADSKRGTWPFGRYEGDDVKRKSWQVDEATPKFQEVREQILMFERDLLHVLGFDFQVDHPHGYIMRFTRFFDTVKRKKEPRALVMSSSEEDRFTEFGHLVITAANAIANDSSSTTLAIQFKSSSVAAACVSLALRTQEFKVSSLEKWAPKWNEERLRDTDPRLQSASVLIEEQEDIFNQLLDFYDEIQRHNAESAQAAATSPSIQHSARSEAPSSVTMPQAK